MDAGKILLTRSLAVHVTCLFGTSPPWLPPCHTVSYGASLQQLFARVSICTVSSDCGARGAADRERCCMESKRSAQLLNYLTTVVK